LIIWAAYRVSILNFIFRLPLHIQNQSPSPPNRDIKLITGRP
jgi:hypothetical protein